MARASDLCYRIICHTRPWDYRPGEPPFVTIGNGLIGRDGLNSGCFCSVLTATLVLQDILPLPLKRFRALVDLYPLKCAILSYFSRIPWRPRLSWLSSWLAIFPALWKLNNIRPRSNKSLASLCYTGNWSFIRGWSNHKEWSCMTNNTVLQNLLRPITMIGSLPYTGRVVYPIPPAFIPFR